MTARTFSKGIGERCLAACSTPRGSASVMDPARAEEQPSFTSGAQLFHGGPQLGCGSGTETGWRRRRGQVAQQRASMAAGPIFLAMVTATSARRARCGAGGRRDASSCVTLQGKTKESFGVAHGMAFIWRCRGRARASVPRRNGDGHGWAGCVPWGCGRHPRAEPEAPCCYIAKPLRGSPSQPAAVLGHPGVLPNPARQGFAHKQRGALGLGDTRERIAG